MKILLYIIMAVVVLLGAYYFFGPPSADAAVLVYACADDGDLSVTLTESGAIVTSDKAGISGVALTLVPAASGAKYTDGTYTYWSKGDEAFVQKGSTTVLSDCVLES